MPRFSLIAVLLLSIAGCAATGGSETLGPLRKETLYALTDGNALLRLNAGQPQKVLQRVSIKGLQPGEQLLGIDYRVARGMLFAYGSKVKSLLNDFGRNSRTHHRSVGTFI